MILVCLREKLNVEGDFSFSTNPTLLDILLIQQLECNRIVSAPVIVISCSTAITCDFEELPSAAGNIPLLLPAPFVGSS